MRQHAAHIAAREFKVFMAGGAVFLAVIIMQAVTDQSPHVIVQDRDICGGHVICIEEAK